MTTVNQTLQETNPTLAHYASLAEPLSHRGPGWLREARKQALDLFLTRGFPTPADEQWKYTNLAALAATPFTPADPSIPVDEALLGRFRMDPSAVAAEIVLVDGRVSSRLSRIGTLPGQIRIGSLAADLVSPDGLPREAFDTRETSSLMALNLALAEDGVVIHLSPGAIVDRPIHLLHLSTGTGIASPRNIVMAQPGSEITLVESFAGPDSSVYFTNAVTIIDARDAALVDHYRLQREGDAAFHIANLRVKQARSSSVTSRVVSFGAALSRQEVEVLLGGEGSNCQLDGLFVLSGRQHADHHTTIDHATPHSDSQELYKGILDGESRGVFDGKIVVRKDAQKTNSRQVNKNLLLSRNAIVDSKPQLEIHADDVKCNHGSTIGQLDENALFYLRTRGIGLAEARTMLTWAFASEVVDRMKVESVRAQLRALLTARLGPGVRGPGSAAGEEGRP